MKGPDLEFKTGTEFTVETDGPSRTTAPKPASPTPFPASVAAPSAAARLYTNPGFRVTIPENWTEFSKNPVTLGPTGAFRINNGRSELTHGLMIGVAAPATGSLEEISERFVAAVMKSSPRMQKQGDATAATIGGVNGTVVLFAGPGSEGITEVVAIHTALLPGSKFFYAITVAPEPEIGVYREAFNKVIASIEFVN
jgi:hypothetical protein